MLDKLRLPFACIFVGLVALLFVHRAKHPSFIVKESLIPFESSMMKRNPSYIKKVLEKKMRKDSRWRKYRELYNTHLLHGAPNEVRIPKIIHQIWLGGKLPERYKEIQKTWQKFHPDWEYRLWTDEDAKTFKMQNRKLFESATNFGEKADIFRYEILYQMGGLYVDTDFECLRPFDILHKLLDFYTGLDTIEKSAQSPRLLNGLIGCIPGHPIIKQCLDTMSGEGPREDLDLIQFRTGPGLITRTFCQFFDDRTYKNAALPSSFFYPIPSPERDGTLGGPIKDAWIEEESFAVHYWDGSWIAPKK